MVKHNRTSIIQTPGSILHTYPKPKVLLNLESKFFYDLPKSTVFWTPCIVCFYIEADVINGFQPNKTNVLTLLTTKHNFFFLTYN